MQFTAIFSVCFMYQLSSICAEWIIYLASMCMNGTQGRGFGFRSWVWDKFNLKKIYDEITNYAEIGFRAFHSNDT